MWHQTGSFAHNAPNSPGLSRPRPPEGVCFGTMELDFGDTSFSWRSPVHLGWFPEEALGLPCPVSALSGSSFPSMNFVFQELPLWGGATGPALSQQSHHVDARKPRIQVFLMIWVLILFLLRQTKYSYPHGSIMLF